MPLTHSQTIRTIRFGDKTGVPIRKTDYDAIKEFILTLLSEEEHMDATTLMSRGFQRFQSTLKHETGWYLYQVKLDLESRGLINHSTPSKRNRRAKLAKISSNTNTSSESEVNVNDDVVIKYKELFSKKPMVVRAPGRINLIGEHTDYNNGFVMAAAIDKGIQFAIGSSIGETLIYSLKYKQYLAIDMDRLAPVKAPDWHNYLLGILSRLKELGYELKPFNCVFEGDLPTGAGLSSSAAMECGFVMALNSLFNLGLSKIEMVKIAQWAEHNFAGVQCGIMDQFASMMGKANHVIYLDCQTLEYSYRPLDLGNYTLLLCDTNVKHSLASSEYNTRRNECMQGVGIIKSKYPAVQSLRDVTPDMLASVEELLPATIFNRCAYVVGENQRVTDAAQDLANNDLVAFGKKMYATHEGLSHLYEVSCEELDFLIELSKRYDGVIGSRMMGGGFGGCTLNIIDDSLVGKFMKEAKSKYKEKFGRELTCYVVNTAEGASIIKPASHEQWR
jgi:galactokinase